jgi:hypothetical protein
MFNATVNTKESFLVIKHPNNAKTVLLNHTMFCFFGF